ncbi:hypothetical protein AB0M32_10255 [Streptomyces sp. NPDC051985]|uniref:hypothetical protein n=1 Tax=Streptomyces sp. NPDC051985 TaxID=3155807 RepID=UPI00341DC9A8
MNPFVVNGLPALGLVTFGSVPLATNAGEWLERRVPSTPLLRRHADRIAVAGAKAVWSNTLSTRSAGSGS